MDWQKTIAEFRKSGLSGSEFARRKGITVSRFHYHLSKKTPKAKAKPKANGFIDLTAAPMIEIETKAGTILRLPTNIDPLKLKQILEAIQ